MDKTNTKKNLKKPQHIKWRHIKESNLENCHYNVKNRIRIIKTSKINYSKSKNKPFSSPIHKKRNKHK